MLAHLDTHLRNPRITDVLISSNAGLWVDQGEGLQLDASWSYTEPEVRALAVELIGRGGRHIDQAHPCVDVRLPGNIRVHAVLSPVASSGTTIALRIPRTTAFTWEDRVASGFMTEREKHFLLECVERKRTVLITGGAGSGKTSLLGHLLSSVPHHERIVVLEDVTELQIDHPHVIALEAQQANIEGAGGVSVEQLVPQALRMRADRLVLGECRGAEVGAVLSALNTGHSGGGLTLHANSLADVPARLTALGYLAGMSTELVAALARGGLDVIVHVERGEHGRRIAALGEFIPGEGPLTVREFAL
ncbi:pilus assembly protein CpaF [Aurantimicrobium minutum]|uniref:CpaF family protein n=1 Tax=Aurantimicrobium minutum TaxID=708131 RepID=UPI002474F8F7|nr:ATPase, T2SS/T4P/T4SS family [Aurantimicrobium minutum]MDH6425194.1 pilus assembly protein CpaF [Aurantimicrobium minutum]